MFNIFICLESLFAYSLPSFVQLKFDFCHFFVCVCATVASSSSSFLQVKRLFFAHKKCHRMYLTNIKRMESLSIRFGSLSITLCEINGRSTRILPRIGRRRRKKWCVRCFDELDSRWWYPTTYIFYLLAEMTEHEPKAEKRSKKEVDSMTAK